jgi:hypothetical protein
MLRRILGLVILLSTIVVMLILFAAAYLVGPVLDGTVESLNESMVITEDALHTVSATLEQSKSTLVAVNGSLDTAVDTTRTLSQTVSDTIPALEQIAVVVSDQTPRSIEAVQAAVPNIAAVAGVVDTTLTKLSDFGVHQTIPIPFNPIEIDFDLGIDYQPVEPFDETMLALGDSLDGLPEELRKVRGQLEVSAVNLLTLSEDLDRSSGDIEAINQELEAFIPLLDQYIGLIEQIITNIGSVQEQVAANLQTIKLVATILPIVLVLTQIAPLVVGWDLLTARNEPEVVAEEAKEQLIAEFEERPASVIKEPEEQVAQAVVEDTLTEDQEADEEEA